MKAVGIKALKAHLSEYLRLVKAGETILVTDRDEVVAELRPVNRQPVSDNNPLVKLQRLAEEGRVTLASEDLSSWTGVQRPLSAEGITSREVLDDLRSEE